MASSCSEVKADGGSVGDAGDRGCLRRRLPCYDSGSSQERPCLTPGPGKDCEVRAPMSEQKGWATSLRGLFVEPDEGAGDAAAQAPAEAAAANAATAAPAAPPPSTPAARAAAAAPGLPAGDFPRASAAAPPGKLDFAAIYTPAGVAPEEQERVAQGAELLHALPEGTEAARHIVEAALKAFGVPVEKILAAGDREMQALDA